MRLMPMRAGVAAVGERAAVPAATICARCALRARRGVQRHAFMKAVYALLPHQHAPFPSSSCRFSPRRPESAPAIRAMPRRALRQIRAPRCRRCHCRHLLIAIATPHAAAFSLYRFFPPLMPLMPPRHDIG